MKRLRKWQRTQILSLLCFSVFAPMFLVSYRLRYHSLEGRAYFVEDLSSINHRTNTLKLSALGIEQEDAGVKTRDRGFTTVRYSLESLRASQSDDDSRITSLGRKGTIRYLKEEKVQIHPKRKPPSMSNQHLPSGKQTEVGTSEQDERAISKPATGIQNIHYSQMRRSMNEEVESNQQDEKATSPPTTKSQNNHYFKKRKALDEKVKAMKDQLIRAKVYLSFATPAGNTHLAKELKLRMKEVERTLGEARRDADLSRRAHSRMKYMEATLLKANHAYPDCSAMVKKLRTMEQNTEEQVKAHRNQTTFLTQLAGRTTPKGLHCLSMRLTMEYFARLPEEREPSNPVNIYNSELFHYVVFSDNVLACAVVVNSTISNAKDPEKIVFHIVTDPLNHPAISMWFLLNPPGQATVQVQGIDTFKQLSAKYGSIMVPNVEKGKSIDLRYTSPLNHLRFYLPELFPQLDKVLFLDHDIVVLKDLSALWREDMKGKINGAVQTCHHGETSHRWMNMLINFSDPWVAQTFDVNSCTWAFGMNLFDLKEWRNQDISSRYHRFLLMGYSRPLWKSGSLPLGWVTFYNQTHPLDPRWHVLGLGHEAGAKQDSIDQAAVIHYDGVMKPWLDIGSRRYKGYWSKNVDFNDPYLQQCNLHA